jgi:hypothetical protein
MMTSVWDKSEVEKQFGECRDLREVIAKLERDFSDRGEVICEIRVNGMLLNEADETGFAGSLLNEIQSLAVGTQRPDSLIHDALNSAFEYLPRLRAACEPTADLFRTGDHRQAQARFTGIIEGCQWLVDTVCNVRQAGENIGHPIHDKTIWTAAEEGFTNVISEILSAFQKRDFVLVADIIEYDLDNALESWLQVLTEERARRASSAGENVG